MPHDTSSPDRVTSRESAPLGRAGLYRAHVTDDLGDQLATDAGRRAVAAAVAQLVRRQDFDRAERLLLNGLTNHPGPITLASRGVAAADVEVIGWEDLDADLLRLRGLGHDVTAVQLDLSNYAEAQGSQWWDKEPVVEVAAYTDAVFPFSTSSRMELLRHVLTPATPWAGGATGAETALLTTSGLRALNGALLLHASQQAVPAWRRQGPDREVVSAFLGGWWLHLRFHQAVKRRLDEIGLALPVPVLVGSHEVGPWLQSAYRVDRVSAPPSVQTDPDGDAAEPAGAVSRSKGRFGGSWRRQQA